MYLGIDLGTTNSAIAGNSKSGLRIFKTIEGQDVLPSAIYINKSGHRFYGKRAYDQAVLSPQNTALGFKRLMGTSTPFEFADARQSFMPEECSAEILRQLLAQAYLESGEQQAIGAIITIPAAFNQMQSEATLRAAKAAGLERVALLQEPVAAAMAAMMRIEKKSGQFLVYDLGGGTFDLALVQALNGEISILDHEGINMLGGRDFDKAIVNAIVRPWLLANFDLPVNLQPRYERVIRIAQLAAEKAKITISTKSSEIIHAADDEVRMQDESGADIYLEVELTRRDLEALVLERINETIQLASKVLKNNGYSHDDIDRVVFIGGPTKMPLIRERVPAQLGIAGDFSVDPMIAVALGAAIFAESRDWGEAESTRKASRASATAAGPLAIAFDYPARTANEEALLRVRVGSEAASGCEVQIDADTGWTSGRQSLTDGLSLKLPLREVGEHAFRAAVFDPHGRPVVSASSEFTIVRTHASARSIPATQNIAVKVRESEFNERNTLHVFLRKGTPLPASGSLMIKAIEELKSGEVGHIDIELFQQDRLEAPQPELNLSVGSFRIEAKDLPDGRRLRKHDQIKFHWRMDDSGVLTASVELPSLGQIFREARFYTPQAGHRSFEGGNGTRLAARSLDQAEEDLERATQIVGCGAGSDLGDLQERLARHRQQLEHSFDADGNRSITEEARRLRQDVAILLHRPEHRAAAFTSELAELKSTFNFGAREIADPRSVKRFDELAQSASREIAHGGFDDAERALEEMRAVMGRVFWSDPAFVAEVFGSAADESYLAIDPELYERQVEAGHQALARADIDGLRQVVFEMMRNRISLGGSGKTATVLATIMRA